MSDRLFGAVAGLVALMYIVSATQIQSSFMTDPVGPKLFPMIIGGVALLCAVTIFLKPDESPSWPAPGIWVALLCAVLALVGYAYALKPLGFLIPTAVVSMIISYLIRRNVLTAALTGMGLSVGLFLLFKYALGLGLVAFSKNLIG
ncbi:MAG: tripartite tricarboxylate transporter TctB family protein [Gammaproteobacteria bacterium]|nr:tripartite tricarboxylate transporter TctB family protein [Gammaproteobacteria bacterium]